MTDTTITDTQDTDDNVVTIGGGGRIYRDSRRDEEEDDNPPVTPPPWADRPEPPPRKPSVVTVVQPPAPEEETEEPDERGRLSKIITGMTAAGPLSTVLELAGMTAIATAGFLITTWLGVLIAGICLLVLGVAIGRKPTG